MRSEHGRGEECPDLPPRMTVRWAEKRGRYRTLPSFPRRQNRIVDGQLADFQLSPTVTNEAARACLQFQSPCRNWHVKCCS